MKRSVFMTAGMAAALLRPAMADDLTISSRTTAAVATATAANSSPGNVTIASGGTVEVSLPSAAVMLSSNNSIINNGLISNTGGNTSIGVDIFAGNTGSFLNSGNITLTGTANKTVNQFGVVLNGTGAFTGNIATGNASSITTTGVSAQAVSIRADLAGNLTLRGNVLSTGTNAVGVSALASIYGTFTNAGNITAAGGGTSTTADNPSSGGGVTLGGNVLGGILNAGPSSSTDTTPAASINVIGTQPALLIAPSVGGNLGAIGIGLLPDTVNPGNSIINRGHIVAAGTQPGFNTTGLQIGNNVGDSAVATVLSGPILNAGSIEASATSDTKNATTLTATVTNATAVIISNGTTVPALVNTASGNISATTGGPVGGTATALAITSGATLPSLNNAGSITASANTTNTAITTLGAQAIVDSSGLLTRITNSGTISATATKLDTKAQTAVALSLTATPLPVTITNAGTIIGDIAFGSSANNVLTIEGPHASVTGQVRTTGSGRVNIAISGAGTGGTLITNGTIQAGTLTVGPGGTLNLGITAANAISATGAATFDASSHLIVTPLSLLPVDTNITLVHSDTALSFGNLSATTQGIQIPFLFEGNLTSNPKNLILALHRKSASELGLTGDHAVLFGPATAAASADSALGAAFSSLESSAAVDSALTQLLPVINGAAKMAADTVSNSTTNALALHQRMLTSVPEVEGGVTPWVEGLYDRYHDGSTAAYSGDAAGGTAGIDYSVRDQGHFGIAFTYYSADLTEAARVASTTSKWVLASPYMGIRLGAFFINAQFNAGVGSLHFARTADVGSLERSTTASENQWLAGGGITGGYVIDLGPIKLVPQINLNGMDLKLNNYTEQGGGTGVDLAVKERSLTSLRAFAGAAASGSFAIGSAHLVPELFAGWSQELLTPTNSVDASFAAVPDTAFTIAGPNEERSRFVGTGSLAYVAGNWSVGLSYNRDFQSKANVQSARLTLAGRF